MVKHLAKQVKESSRVRHGGSVRPIGDRQLQTPVGKALVTAGMVNWGTDPAFRPGRLYGRASGPNGISARVFSQKSSDKTLSLFYITGGRAVVNFVNYTCLIDYLPNTTANLDGATTLNASLSEMLTNGLTVFNYRPRIPAGSALWTGQRS